MMTIAYDVVTSIDSHFSIAQLAEQTAVNRCVPGSSPGGGAGLTEGKPSARLVINRSKMKRPWETKNLVYLYSSVG